MSEIIKIPNGWYKAELGIILELLTDYTANGSFESLRDNVQYYSNEEYAVLVRTTDLNKRKFIPQRFTDYKGWKYLRKTALFGNEILIANVGSVGNVYRVPFYNQPMTLAPNMYLLKFSDEVSEDYLYYVLTNKEFKINLLKQLGSTTLQAINKDNLRNIEVLVPTLKQEQQKIAEVLGEVDNAISKTEELFEKNKRIKTALMQDLLSYGIDENGKIRHPLTHKFKPSELGDIPDEWNCVELKKVTFFIKDGTHGTHKDVNDGIPLLSAKDIKNGNLVIPDDCRRISKSDYNQIHQNYEILENDVLMSIVGTIGEVAIVKTMKIFTLQRSVAIFRFKELYPKFAYYSLTNEQFYNQLLANINASAQGGIYLGALSNCKIKYPRSEIEQQRIAQILSSQDEKIEDIKNKLIKLKSLKASLMQDLLCGRKRVTKLMEENL